MRAARSLAEAAETRVMPEPLGITWLKLKDAWPL